MVESCDDFLKRVEQGRFESSLQLGIVALALVRGYLGGDAGLRARVRKEGKDG